MSNRVLIVEDEAIVALDLQIQLQDLGYRVSGVAASAARALELARTARPHVVLMDVRLDGPRDGIDAAEQITRELTLPVVFLTAHSDHDTVSRAAATAPYGFLTKPFQIRELHAAIEVALARSQRERSERVVPAAAEEGDSVRQEAGEQVRAQLSHEMRAPLNAVIGFAQLLQLDGQASEAQRGEYVRHIETAGRHLLSMIDDALDADRPPPVLLTLDAAAVLRDVALSLHDAAAAQQVTLRCRADTPLLARADGVDLRSALLSLAGMALKFSRAGDEVRLDASVDAANPAWVLLSITDAGTGLTAAQRARLVRTTSGAAQAADAPEQAAAAGSFGFAVARALVEAMGGRITIASTPGEGTCVRVRLEAARAS